MAIKTGVYGATGYTGVTLLQRLTKHPGVEIVFATSESSAGKKLTEIDPQAPAITLIAADQASLADVDHVFLCLPHTTSAPIAKLALQHGCKVVDLSADLRLDDSGEYQRWYHVPHPSPDLLPIPYGLPEIYRRDLIGASCIANPGCYATSVLLPLLPLAEADILSEGQPIIVDAKSGVSGAGRAPKANTLFGAVHGNFSPYAIGREHRHLGEIEQELNRFGLAPGKMIFTPHLLPVDRGILSTIYISARDASAIRPCLAKKYAQEELVTVLPSGEFATLAHVTMTPKAVISITEVCDEMAVLICVIDNLLKGAASQAIQNFNLMWGFAETTALL